MATAAAIKLNNGLYYVGMPRELCKRSLGLSVSARFLGGLFESFSGERADGSTVSMSRTHEELRATLGIAPATSTRSTQRLEQGGFINRAGAYSYVFNHKSVPENASKWYCPLELLNSYFDIKDADGNVMQLKLTKSTCLVYAYFYTKLNSTHGRGCVQATFKEIAEELGICDDTVSKAVEILRQTKLIIFPRGWKGSNRYCKSKIRLRRTWGWFKNESAYRARIEQRRNTQDDGLSREEYYAKAQEQAQEKAEKARRRAEKNSSFNTLTEEVDSVRKRYLEALLGNQSEANRLADEMNALIVKRVSVLENIGLSEEELNVEYYAKCKECRDTGWQGDGTACDCYTKHRRGSPPRRKIGGCKAN